MNLNIPQCAADCAELAMHQLVIAQGTQQSTRIMVGRSCAGGRYIITPELAANAITSAGRSLTEMKIEIRRPSARGVECL